MFLLNRWGKWCFYCPAEGQKTPLPTLLRRYGKITGNYSVYRGKAPNLRCLRVRSTRKHLKFGDLPIMAE